MTLTMCRVCMNTECPLFSPYEAVSDGTCAVDFIASIAQIQIKEDDGLPQLICSNCMEDLERTKTLIKTCRDSDSQLRKMFILDKSEITSDEYHVIEAIHEVEVINESEPEDTAECSEQEAPIELLDMDDIIEEETFDSDELISEPGSVSTSPADELIIADPAVKILEDQTTVDTTCCGCLGQFDSLELLQEHSRVEHLPERAISGPVPSSLIECTICYKLIAGISYLDSTHQIPAFRDRLVSAEFPETVQCCSCEVLCYGPEELSQHSLQHRRAKIAEDPLRPFECQFCFKRYKVQQDLIVHQRFSFSYKKFMRTKRRGSLAAKKRLKIEQSGSQRKCCGCLAKFPSEDSLRQHSQMHHELYRRQLEQPFECQICFKQFPTRARLEQHKLVPYSRTHQCSKCERSFISAALLAKHSKSHGQDGAEEPAQENSGKQVQCDECGKIFKNKHHLQRHRKCQHSEEKPFSCKICQRKFKWKHTLQSHLRIHTKEQLFSCSHCKRKFTHLTDKNRHELTHTKQFPLKCSVCEKGFPAGRKKLLEKHMQLHEAGEDYPLACQFCDKKFTRLAHRNKHQEKHLAPVQLEMDESE